MSANTLERLSHLRDDLLDDKYGVAAVIFSGGHSEITIKQRADPLDMNTRFEIGSLTKNFIATLLAVTVLKGKAGLTDEIGKYTECHNANAVTFLQLATHSSGLPRLSPSFFASDAQKENPFANQTPDVLLEDLRKIDTPVPGEHAYSNFGFSLLAYVLATIWHESIEDLLTAEVFEPLRLTITCHGAENLVSGYSGNRPVPHWDDAIVGAGSLRASITDMQLWLGAQLGLDTSLSEPIALTQKLHYDTEPVKVGLGWFIDEDIRFNAGETGGFQSFIGFDRSRTDGVAALCNRSVAEGMYDACMRQLRDA